MNQIPPKNLSRILCVDDDVTSRLIVEAKLKNDYDILLAASGKEAIDFLAEKMVDLILLDIMMPEMDGYAVIEILKQNDRLKSIPIIFLTGMTSPKEIQKGFEVGGSDYLVKPYSTLELKARINTQLKLIEAQNMLVLIAQANTVKSMIVSLHHEINNPLTVLRGTLGVMEAELDGYKDKFKNLNTAMHRIELIIDKMSKIEEVHFEKYTNESHSSMMLKLSKE